MNPYLLDTMQKIKQWSKRLIIRLALSFTLLVIIVTTGLTYLAIKQETTNLHQELQRQALIQANNLATSIAAYIITSDYTSIESILTSAAQFENIISIQAIDATNKILGDIVKTPQGEIVSRYDAATLTPPQPARQTITLKNNSLFIWQPIELGDVVGWVRIHYSINHVSHIQKRIWRDNIINSSLLVTLSFILLVFVLRKPLKSIAKYTEFADSLEDYNGELVGVDSSSPELDRLGNALNKASTNLQAQNSALNEVLTKFENAAAIAEHSPDIILSVSDAGDVEYTNTRTRIVLNELGLSADNAIKLLPEDYSALRKKAFQLNHALVDIESTIGGRSFSWKLSPFSASAVLHCHAIEITEQKSNQKALQDSKLRYQTLFECATDAILLIHNKHIIDFNLHATSLFGGSSEELRRATTNSLLPPNQQHGGHNSETTFAAYIESAENKNPQTFEWQFKRFNGVIFDADVSLNVTVIDDKNIIMAIIRDITQRKQVEAKLIRQANFDTLTGLPNRVLSMDRLAQSIKRAHRQKTKLGVLFIDVDHFKTINDSLGHSVGDEMIIEIARRLKTCIRDCDSTARFGGDEFMVILGEITSTHNIQQVVEKIIAAMNTPFFISGQEFFLGASIGVSTYPDDGDDAQSLLRNADAAMYRAKEAGRNTFQFYAPEFNIQAKERVRMEGLLRKALEHGEFFLAYQPQIDIQTGEIVGAEALIRWQSPELGLVQPDQFIRLAEDTGMIVPIGEWVIHTACHAAKAWQKDLGLELRISVNVSQRQFSSSTLITQVSKILRKSELAPEFLELEITESMLMDQSDKTLDIIHAFKQLGLSLALDDFGTGYSSLSYLKRFPFDVLKIDRAFVNDITNGIDQAGLCIAILAIASTFHMSVIAEGVENEEQLAFLHSSGADIAQGYYFSKPLPDEVFRQYVLDYMVSRKKRFEAAAALESSNPHH